MFFLFFIKNVIFWDCGAFVRDFEKKSDFFRVFFRFLAKK